ncbi:phosphonate C-P lyase system protein PhnH [Devosia aurantiaca]|uniref:Phosphonate C-P lyase system protein PhnH n=1 Tax=Devosia aurantiaca TaxID=2714858 RepID=A0A6M1SN35_9HYPH|nr:phosphonate C-P lyase system protein PhnH [Devosia aurantiaca]NGP16912.1 phosphonate C-P lyase system protein PhnH [Devosia aurantiaca]
MFNAGFADPVHDAQQAFRAILDALARPGTTHALASAQEKIGTISADLSSVMLTVTDHDTPIWLSPNLLNDITRQAIGFHAGAPITSDPAQAMFAFIEGALPSLDQFNLGTQDYPDRSTTLVVALPALEGGSELILRGPGIEDHWHISPQGLPDDFVTQWSANRDLFPRGVDMLLVSGGKVMGLPRTVRIGEAH